MRIEGEKVILRPYTIQDVDRLAVIANNYDVYSNLRDGFPHPYTPDHARSWIEMVTDPGFKSFVFAIEYSGQLAGSISVSIKDDIYRLNGEIGYFIAEEFWGHGIASEAVMLITDFAFSTLGIIRLYAEPFAWNEPSKRVLEKAGYRLEATLKDYVIKNGEIIDSCIYSLLKSKYVTDRGK